MRKINTGEYLPAARWCLAVAAIAFAAVVSLHKYIDIADMAAFSSQEAMFAIMTDITNIVFIYLPLYLFIVCGIMFGEGFGCTAVLRCGSRGRWLAGKLLSCLVNTALFSGAIIAINLIVCGTAFSRSGVWSEGFVSYRVMTGSPASDFAYGPVPTITGACLSAFLYYLLCGLVNMFFSLLTGRESAGLLFSLLFGIGIGLAEMTVSGADAKSQFVRCAVLLALAFGVYALTLTDAMKKDLC